jgi:hypothetical protein
MPAPPRSRVRPTVAKARRAAPFAHLRERALSRHAEEALFEHAEVLLEGATRTVGGQESFFGSVMMAVSFEALSLVVRGLEQDEVREDFTRCVDGSVRVRLRAMRMASGEVARRFPDRSLGTALIETNIRRSGDELHIDVDVEVPFDVCSRRGTGD